MSLLCCNTWNCPQFWQTSAVWLSVWSEVQTCIRPSWCHCHSLSLASVKSRLVLPFWYRLTWVVPDKGMCCPEYVYFYPHLTLYHCLWVIKRSLQSVWTTEAPISIKVWKTRQTTTGCNFSSCIRTDYDYRKFSDESDSKIFENQSTFGEVMDKSRPRPMCTIFWFTVLV